MTRSLVHGSLAVAVVALLNATAAAQVLGASNASGILVEVSLDGDAEIAVAPVPFIQGTAPPAYNQTNSVASATAGSGALGTVVDTGAIEVEASSDVPGATSSSARSTVSDVEVGLETLVLTLLGVQATTVESTANVSGTCGAALTPTGTTTLEDAEAVVSGILGATALADSPAPNSEPLSVDLGLLSLRLILNEQIISGDGVDVSSITVNAIHIEIEGADLPLVGEVRGDIIIGQSQATIDCTLPDPCQDFATSSSFGESVRLRLGGVLELASGPLPSSEGTAPPTYAEANGVPSISVSNVLFGSLLSSGTVDTTADSDFPNTSDAMATATVEDLGLTILPVLANPLLELAADVIASEATVTGTCGGSLTESGSTTLTDTAADVLGVAQGFLAASPAPNSEPLAGILPSGVRLILNEQIVDGDGTSSRAIVVNAIHLSIDNIDIPLLGTLAGDVIISQSRAEIVCASCAASIGIAKSAGQVTNQGNGSFTVPITFTVENLGNVGLPNVQITDDFDAAFTGAATFSIESGPTSASLTVNPGFDGMGDTNLLAGTDFLAPGSTAQAQVTVRFSPNGESGPFLNQAVVAADDPTGGQVTDLSDDGTDSDPNDNGDSGDAGEDDPTPIRFDSNPVIGIAKAALPTTDNGNGTFTTMITMTVANLGDVPLSNVQVTDDLATVVPGGSCSAGAVVASGTLTANPGFDGLCSGGSAETLNAASSTLPVGASETITFSFTFDPGVASSPLLNQAIGTGEGPGGGAAQDDSDDGIDPDPNDDGDAGDTGEDDPTPIDFDPDPQIGVAKAAGAVVDNGDGTLTVPITITVENLGNTDLVEVDVVDDLSLTFPAPATCMVTAGPTATGTLTANAAYDGNCGGVSASLLIPGSSTLPIGAAETISFTVQFDPGSVTTFFNTAMGFAESLGGATTSDVSDNGDGSDANGNGEPDDTGEDDPTPVVAAPTIQIGVAKQAGTIVNNGDGSFTVPITISVENLGSAVLSQVQVVEDLDATFPLPVSFSLDAAPVAGGTLVANAGFDGSSDASLLDSAASTIHPGATATISFSVTFEPNGASGPFFDQVLASGRAPDNTVTTDLSGTGIDPDPNGNGDPTESGENDPTAIAPVENPVIGLAKSASPAEKVGPDTFRTTLTIYVENLGDVPLTDISVVDDLTSTFPPPATFAVLPPVVATGTLASNPAYDGDGVAETLVPASSTLAVGATAEVRIRVDFTPNGTTPPFFNVAFGDGTGPLGGMTMDTSDAGTNPDSNGDGDAGDIDEADPTAILLASPAPVMGSVGLAVALLLTLLVGASAIRRENRRRAAAYR